MLGMIFREYDAVTTTEEIVTPEEFLKRRKEGSGPPDKVKIAMPSCDLPFGGFKIELETPYYEFRFDGGRKHV